MSTFKPLKTLTSRRQVLKAGLAALTLSGMSQAIAKEEPLKTSNGHSKPKAKKSGGKRVVVLDPGHGGIDTGAIGRNGSKENMWCWQLPRMSVPYCVIMALMRV